MKRSIKLNAYMVIFICDLDGCEGRVEFNGSVLLSCPEKYKHTCKECDQDYILNKKYPSIDHREIDNE